MKKLVKLAAVRQALDAFDRDEVTYSRMVEMINEQANKELQKGVDNKLLLPTGYEVYQCVNCQQMNVKKNNGEITVGFCDNCDHPLWN